MIRILLLYIIFFHLGVIAQLVIDSINYTPKTWEMFEKKKSNFSNINYKNTGATFTWNFINATVLSTDTLMYDSIDGNNCNSGYSGFSYNFPWVGQVGLINLNAFNNAFPSYVTAYKKYTANGLFETGGSNCWQPVGIFYYKSFPFPLSVTTNYSVTENYTGIDFSPPGTSYSTWYYKLIGDGYGTLSLPGGINYTNCLRLYQVMIDSGTTIIAYDTIYYWLSPGIHHPVLEVHANSFNKDAYFVSATGSVADIKQVKNNNGEISIYPNPSNGTFSLSNLTIGENIEIEIQTDLGKSVYSENLNIFQSYITLNLKIISGIYFVKLQTKQGRKIYKLVVGK